MLADVRGVHRVPLIFILFVKARRPPHLYGVAASPIAMSKYTAAPSHTLEARPAVQAAVKKQKEGTVRQDGFANPAAKFSHRLPHIPPAPAPSKGS